MQQINQYLPGAGAYFSEYKIELVLTFKDDKNVSLEADVEPAAEELGARLKRYCDEHPAYAPSENVDETIDQVVQMFISGFKVLETTYILDGNDITIGQMTGTVSGNTMKLYHSTLEQDIIFTRN